MKVLHLTLGYKIAPALGGPNFTAYKLCTALQTRGVEVHVICTNLASRTTVIQPESFVREIDGVNVSYLATRQLMRLNSHSFGIYYVPELKSILQRSIRQYDLVHIHGFYDFITLCASRHARRAGIPYLIQPEGTVVSRHTHSVWAKSLFDRVCGRPMFEHASALIAASDLERECLHALGADPSKIELAYNGIESCDYDPSVCDMTFRARYHISERFVVLYFGRVHMIKGIDHMVRAVAGLRRRGLDAAAVVVGPDEGYGATLTHIAHEERFEHLYLLPAITETQAKQEMFGSADVLVYAGFQESFGICAFEGILSGVPTIVAAGTGCGQIVQRFDAGTVVSYGDIEELERALQTILTKPHEARIRTLAARPRIVRALDWGEIAGQICQLYERIRRQMPA